MHCDFFKIYCASPNLGITRVWICLLNLVQRPIFSASGSEISDSGPLFKVPPGGLVLRLFTSWKNPSTSASRVCTREPWISRRACYPETTEADNHSLGIIITHPVGCSVNKRIDWLFYLNKRLCVCEGGGARAIIPILLAISVFGPMIEIASLYLCTTSAGYIRSVIYL